jgi:DNA-binding GntR family transcriptional regulator
MGTYVRGVSIDHEGDVPVYLQLVEILRARIASGELVPHRPIPSIKTLSQEYEIAKGTVEKALGVLKAAGEIHTVIGRGMYVTEKTPSSGRGAGGIS